MQSINLTTAFAVTQFALLVTVFVGITILRMGEASIRVYQRIPQLSGGLYTLFAGFALISFGVLIFSDDILTTSRPVFGDLELPSFSKDSAFILVFIMDLLGATILIALTGGSLRSPFAGLLLMLPTIAIFLREPPSRFLPYAMGAGLMFLAARHIRGGGAIELNPYYGHAFTAVAVLCLLITTAVGYATRPSPI